MAAAANILLIWGEDFDQPWSAEVFSALTKTTADTRNVQFFHETLSVNRLGKLPDSSILARQLNDKYANIQFDRVIAFEHRAALALNSMTTELMPGTPKLSILDNGDLPSLTNRGTDNLLPSHLRDVNLLLPNLTEHLVISSLPIIKNQYATLTQPVGGLSLASDEQSLIALLEQVKSLPQDSAITYAVMHRDSSGTALNPREVLEQILAVAQVPVFVKYSSLLIPGVVGGHVFDATKVAQFIVQSSINPDYSGATMDTLKLDATELERWKIPSNRIPDDAQLYNLSPPLLQTYAVQLKWAVAGLILALSLVLMMAYLLKTRSENLRLSESNRRTAELLKREAEERLAIERGHNEQQRFTQIATESAQIGTFRYDQASDQIWLSTSSARMLDATTDADGVLDKFKSFLTHRVIEQDEPSIQVQLDTRLTTRSTLTFRVRLGDGELRWIYAVVETMQQEHKSFRVGVLRDITDERLLTEKLLRSQERMSLALEAANIELFEVEVATGQALALSNGRGAYQLGQRFSFVDGLSTLVLSRSTREELSNLIRQERHRFEFTEHSIHGDKYRWNQVVTGNFYERDGKKYITAVYTDISELRQQEHSARRQAQENELALNASEAGVARINSRTGQTWMSSRAQEIWDTGPLVGDSTRLMALAEMHHPEDDERVRQAFREMIRGVDVGGQEYRIRLKNGDYRWIKAFGQAHYDINGSSEVIAVFYDINSEKQRLEEVEAARERQARLFAIIGHELRTPIATLQMMLEEQGSYQLKPLGAQIQETMRHTLSVLDDLRSVTQPQLSIQVETPSSIYDQVEQVLESLNRLLQENGIQAHFNPSPSARKLSLYDRQSLRQLTTNLIKNAALHSGADKLWVDLEAADDSDRLVIKLKICDNGKGIPQTQIERLFAPFERGNTDADGTGMGLHICRDIAQRMGGTLTYTTRPDGGACFTLQASFKLAGAPEAQPEQQLDTDKPLSGMRVLFAEDQKTLQLLTAALLRKQGAEVCVANNGEQALELFEAGDYDFVLTDIMMPQLDGYGLTRTLRERGYEGKIIGLTAATIGLETDQLIELGANATLSKPIDIKRLCALALSQEPV